MAKSFIAGKRLDRGTILGLMLACLAIVTGLLLDGGRIGQILQPTAALIVLLGTLSAVLVQFPLATVREAALELRALMLDASPSYPGHVETLVGYALEARSRGIVKLDGKLASIEDDFLRKSLMYAVDGVAIRELRERMDVDLRIYEEKEGNIASVFEAAGGFAPTLGILGAVLGLIQVMQKLDNIGEVGKGIAVAFVATLYGVGSANLLFIPIAGKLRIRMRERQMLREMTLDAVISIVEGISARALRENLQSYLDTKLHRLPLKPILEKATN
jgi:chemotaxis protein MotA